jgi:hypothetical protein
VDEDSLTGPGVADFGGRQAADAALKTLSSKPGIPYQRLLNTLLTANATREETTQSRLNRLKPELHKIKRRVAA